MSLAYTCSETWYKEGGKHVEGLLAKVKVDKNKGDLMVGICCRPPPQEEDEAVFKQLMKVSKLQNLVLMEDFNYHDSFWEGNSSAQAAKEVFGM